MTQEEFKKEFDYQYNIIINKHRFIYKRYLVLKKSEEKLKKGIAFLSSEDEKKAFIQKSLNALQSLDKLPKKEQLEYAVQIFDHFIKKPMETIQMIELLTNKNIARSLSGQFNFDCEKFIKENFSDRYKVLKNIKRYLNSAYPFKEIDIMSSLQLHLAMLYAGFSPSAEDKEINSFVNEAIKDIIGHFKLGTESADYTLGNPNNLNLKIKTIFFGYELLEASSGKNDAGEKEFLKIQEMEQKLYQNPKEYIRELFISSL